MAFMTEDEKKRAAELLRRYNNPMPLEDLLMYASSVYAEGRADERKECLKCVNEVQLNSLKSQRLEVGKSQSGMDFQSGRRKGAEDAMTMISARSALQITQDHLPNSYPEAELTNERLEDNQQ